MTMLGSKIVKSSESRTELLSRIQRPKRQHCGTALYSGVSRCLKYDCDRIHKPNGDRYVKEKNSQLTRRMNQIVQRFTK